MERVFGHIPGYPPGSLFADRAELAASGVHRPLQAGISGSEQEGADSVVLSGGYEDSDFGDEIVYVGQGGRDPASGRIVGHQPLNRGNLALARSRLLGLPVRVVRGAGHASRYAPASGYRYDGLYAVESYWQEETESGLYVWRFLLRRIWEPAEYVAEPGLPRRRETSTLRIVRETAVTQWLKGLHDYRCQVCGVRLEGSAGPYAEAAHVRPLGRPHHGPDTADNVLCLCPNHHVLFDYGAFTLTDGLELIGLAGALRTHPRHQLDPAHLAYHREHYFFWQRAAE
jgi:putative restriction endonuclease